MQPNKRKYFQAGYPIKINIQNIPATKKKPSKNQDKK